jgi:hypothetical protein
VKRWSRPQRAGRTGEAGETRCGRLIPRFWVRIPGDPLRISTAVEAARQRVLTGPSAGGDATLMRVLGDVGVRMSGEPELFEVHQMELAPTPA